MRPRIPRPPSSTARSRGGIRKSGERFGALWSAQAERHNPCNIATLSPGTIGRYGWLPAACLPGTVIYADSSAGTTAPQLLYHAIGAGNLRAWVQGQDDWGGAALAN